jgi:hypothetical protein
LRIGEEIGFVISQTSTMRTDMALAFELRRHCEELLAMTGRESNIPPTVIPAQAGIQYAAAYRLNHYGLWNTGSPPARG